VRTFQERKIEIYRTFKEVRNRSPPRLLSALLPLLEQAMRLNPHYPPFYLGDLGWAYNLSRRHVEAVAALKEATSRGPTLMVY